MLLVIPFCVTTQIKMTNNNSLYCSSIGIAVHISVAIHIVISVVASIICICNSQNHDKCKLLTLNVEQQEI